MYIAVSFLVTLAMLILLVYTSLASVALDKPNHRSLHTTPIPRSGGLAIMTGVIISWLMLGCNLYWLGLLTGLVVLSILDDVHNLSVKLRFLAQVAVSAIFVGLFFPNVYIITMLVLVISTVWLINLYNFMDGSDGLAGGMAFIGFSAYSAAAYLAGDKTLAYMTASVATANLAFLIFNFHPAKIFMGDGGSVPTGFLVSTVGLYGWQHDLWPLWFPIVIFSPFIVDATTTLVFRFFKGEKVLEAHKNHYYQRLIRMGLGHKNVAIAEYILMALSAITATIVLATGLMTQLIYLLVLIAVYSMLMLGINKKWNSQPR